MYGKVLPSATGIALLPATGDNRALFIAAVSLIAGGVAVFVASAILTRKSRAQATK
jgi:hypothetical protein